VTFEQFDTVVVAFPFSDRDQAKRRPALVLSSRAFNGRHKHAVLAMITTAAQSAWPSDHPVIDLQSPGLGTPCVVRLKLFTLDVELIGRRLGTLGDSDREGVREMLAGCFGFGG
jgi:mRNA interferase MazF